MTLSSCGRGGAGGSLDGGESRLQGVDLPLGGDASGRMLRYSRSCSSRVKVLEWRVGGPLLIPAPSYISFEVRDLLHVIHLDQIGFVLEFINSLL